ncbi:PIH1 domain-containing protein 1 [Globomyces sp. JEL0801]|nr:PIH1 domain-containing protein 1 [Globomyces sp. JEL0801]
MDLRETLRQEAMDDDPQLNKLLQEFSKKKQNSPEPILPTKGFVIKTKLVKATETFAINTKVFINLCHSPEIPAPPLLSRIEISKAIQNGDNQTYKVPMSLSQPRTDLDKDVCINTAPYHHAIEEVEFKEFIMSLAVEWIEQKQKFELHRELILPKMMAKGDLVPHFIARAKRPVILPLVEETNGKICSTPKYQFILEPETDPKFLAVQIHLPLLKSGRDCSLDIEENRLIFSNSQYLPLDIRLPYSIDVDKSGAKFDCTNQNLYVTMSIVQDYSE